MKGLEVGLRFSFNNADAGYLGYEVIMSCSMRDIIGGGYDEFWNFKGRYRLVKGGRGSKKSTTTALWYIYNMMMYYYKYNVCPNVLVIRAVKVDHLDTTFAQLQWAIEKLGVQHLWSASKIPMSMTFKPSGQRILFRGLDHAERIKSITTAVGNLCWVWWEEAFEVALFDDVRTVDMSIRGVLPPQLFYQHTFTFNPNVADHWLKREFYDRVKPDTGLSPEGDILAITRNFDCNEFLDDSFKNAMSLLKQRDPDRYRIVALGEWGMNGGIVYQNWTVKHLDWTIYRIDSDSAGGGCPARCSWGHGWEYRYGIDFGFTESPTAVVVCAVNKEIRVLRILDAVYKKGLVASEIAGLCKSMGLLRAHFLADSSHMMAIEEMRRYGMTAIEPVKKGAGSIIVGIERVKEYKIEVDAHCSEFIEEIANYRWMPSKVREDEYTDEPEKNQADHGLDAMRYALSQDAMFDAKTARQLQLNYVGNTPAARRRRGVHPDD